MNQKNPPSFLDANGHGFFLKIKKTKSSQEKVKIMTPAAGASKINNKKKHRG